jgi:hypothetical protein
MIEFIIALAMSLAFLTYRVWRCGELLREGDARLGALEREVRETERRQAEREETRMRLLLDSAGQIGSVKGVTELLAGLLAQMSAKLDRVPRSKRI